MNILDALERFRLRELSVSVASNQKPLPKFVIGGICKNNHEYEYPNKSLRYASGQACFFCQRNKGKKEVQAKQNLCVTCELQIKPGDKVRCPITDKPQCRQCKANQQQLKCRECGAVKDKKLFRKDSTTIIGYRTICTDCNNKRDELIRRQKGMRRKADVLTKKRSDSERRLQVAQNIGIDTQKFCLSELGKCGHNYQGTGLTLRYLGNWHCVECDLSYSKEYRRGDKGNREYRQWLKNPYISLSVTDLVNQEQQRYLDHLRQVDNKEKKRLKAIEKYRKRYQQDPQKERNRIRAYKMANPGYRDKHNKLRGERVNRQSDGSITPGFIKEIIEKSSKCPYCLNKMEAEDKTIDHIIPIAGGGLHSKINLVVCCQKCNSRKHDRNFVEWLDMLTEKGKDSARKVYEGRYGACPEQGFLPFIFE